MLLVDTLRALRERIDRLDVEISTRAKQDEGAQRLMSIPGVGPMIATAIQALAPPAGTFRSGRDFAAWFGLTPVQKSTGGKTRLGRTSRMGERTLRRLLIIGASGVVRWAKRNRTLICAGDLALRAGVLLAGVGLSDRPVRAAGAVIIPSVICLSSLFASLALLAADAARTAYAAAEIALCSPRAWGVAKR